MAIWRSGSALLLINEVNIRRARLVGLLGWVTVSRFELRLPGAALYFGM